MSHSTHTPELEYCWKLPGGHGWHAKAAGPEKDPGWHSRHDPLPPLGMNFPELHAKHEPLWVENEPGGQAWHAVAPCSEDLPEGHSWQVPGLVARSRVE